ncbi:hypothetical protein [Seonamhaeicola sp. ML3]|uniref:hypothetical protein n=1 Tax=Seonamhaeicola sp. ML3 TaxID=2937786 RepID=UPI00200BCE90|nr:hypothetical protein [Seonamhaeicola sp. ML3]
MREFLIEHYSILTKSAEIIAAMTGLVIYGKYKNTPARYFIFFLVYIAFLETTGSYVRFVRADKFLHFLMGTLIEANYWMYTLGWKIAAIVFFSFYYYKILRSTRLKMILKYVGWAYLVFSVIFIVINWKDFFHMSFPTLSILGAVVIFTCCTFYFVELMQSEKNTLFL